MRDFSKVSWQGLSMLWYNDILGGINQGEHVIYFMVWSYYYFRGVFESLYNIVFSEKGGNFLSPILTVKIIEWEEINLIILVQVLRPTYPGVSNKKNTDFSVLGIHPRPSSGKIHISRHQLKRKLNLELLKATSVRTNKNIAAAEIAPQISSALRDLGVILNINLYLVVKNWWMQTLKIVLYTHMIWDKKLNRKIHIIM